MSQSKLFVETNLFVCKHVEVDGLSMTRLDQSRGVFHAIRIRTDESEILLEGTMTVKEERE